MEQLQAEILTLEFTPLGYCVLQKTKMLRDLFKEGLLWCLEDLNASQHQAAAAGTRAISECAKALSAASEHSFPTDHGLPHHKPKFRSLDPHKQARVFLHLSSEVRGYLHALLSSVSFLLQNGYAHSVHPNQRLC